MLTRHYFAAHAVDPVLRLTGYRRLWVSGEAHEKKYSGARRLKPIVDLQPIFVSGLLPKPRKYYSANKNYFIEIIPRHLESQSKYSGVKAKRNEPAGSKTTGQNSYCKGTLYQRSAAGTYLQRWSKALSNDVAPLNALVSDDGAYVVTFDNWHFVGFGDDVVVIYDGAGQTVKKLALKDIVPESEIMRMPMSVSSIFWGGEHYLDQDHSQLVLKVVAKWSGSLNDAPEYKEVRVDLRTGKVLSGYEARDMSLLPIERRLGESWCGIRRTASQQETINGHLIRHHD